MKRLRIELCVFAAGALILVAWLTANAYFHRPAEVTDENLKKFYEITKIDPLFYDPATDVEFLRNSVLDLKNTDDVILLVDSIYRKKQNGEYRDVFPKGWRLWPDEFLSTLPFIYETTYDFLTAPTAEKARELLTWYDRAAAAYQKAAALNVDAIENVFSANPKVKKSQILFIGSGTTPEIVRNDFILINKNAEKLSEEVRQRKRCLFRGECLSIKPHKEKPSGTEVAYQPLPFEILDNAKNKKFYLPGVFRATTPCFGWSEDGLPKNHPFYLKVTADDNNRDVVIPVLTNVRYYRDFEEISNQAFAKLYLDSGIKFMAHNITNDYLCTDLSYLAELFAQYLGLKENENRLAVLPYLIQHTIKFSDAPIYIPILTGKPYLPQTLLVARSAYSLYFGTFSSAIWRLDTTPQFLLKKNFTFNRGYSSYQELRQRGITDEEIARLNDVVLIKYFIKTPLKTKQSF